MFDGRTLVSYRAISLVSCRAEAILIMSFRRGIPPSLISSGQYLSAAEKRIKQLIVNLHRSGKRVAGGKRKACGPRMYKTFLYYGASLLEVQNNRHTMTENVKAWPEGSKHWRNFLRTKSHCFLFGFVLPRYSCIIQRLFSLLTPLKWEDLF